MPKVIGKLPTRWLRIHPIRKAPGVHAYLHRVEGDESNAGYWYGRAEKPHCQTSLEEEWVEIARALLDA